MYPRQRPTPSNDMRSRRTLPNSWGKAPSRNDSRRARSESRGKVLQDRKKPKKLGRFLSQTRGKRERVNQEATQLWGRIDHPTADQTRNHEKGFSADAVAMAKRGRRRTFESACGSTETRKAIRNHERSAWKHGDVTMDAERLLEYPQDICRYNKVMGETHRIAGCEKREEE